MKRKGKRGVAIGLAAALLCLCLPVFARGEELAVSARSAVLLSGESGAVLWEKNAREQLPMASTTKIMTALLTLEEAERAGGPGGGHHRGDGGGGGLLHGPAGRGPADPRQFGGGDAAGLGGTTRLMRRRCFWTAPRRALPGG